MPGYQKMTPYHADAEFIGVLLTELQTPVAHHLIGDYDTSSREDFFDISVAQCKTEV